MRTAIPITVFVRHELAAKRAGAFFHRNFGHAIDYTVFTAKRTNYDTLGERNALVHPTP